MSNVAKQWADAPLQLKQKYQNLIFPRGFVYDIKQHNFISSDISPLYRCISLENTPFKANNSVLVNHIQSNYKQLVAEIIRWNEIMLGYNHLRNRAPTYESEAVLPRCKNISLATRASF